LKFFIGGQLLATVSSPQQHQGSVLLDLASLSSDRADLVVTGRQVLAVEAVGAATRFPLSLTELDRTAAMGAAPTPPRATCWLNVSSFGLTASKVVTLTSGGVSLKIDTLTAEYSVALPASTGAAEVWLRSEPPRWLGRQPLILINATEVIAGSDRHGRYRSISLRWDSGLLTQKGEGGRQPTPAQPSPR
jgi:hypothetical protein